MRPGSALEIQLNDAHHVPLAVPHVFIEVVFLQGGRERYRFDAGETDGSGHLSVSYDHFKNIRKDNQSFALMDYNTQLEACDSTIIVRVPALEELHQRLVALSKWFPEEARVMDGRLKVSNNGGVEAGDARVLIVDNGITRVDLIGRVIGQFKP